MSNGQSNGEGRRSMSPCYRQTWSSSRFRVFDEPRRGRRVRLPSCGGRAGGIFDRPRRSLSSWVRERVAAWRSPRRGRRGGRRDVRSAIREVVCSAHPTGWSRCGGSAKDGEAESAGGVRSRQPSAVSLQQSGLGGPTRGVVNWRYSPKDGDAYSFGGLAEAGVEGGDG